MNINPHFTLIFLIGSGLVLFEKKPFKFIEGMPLLWNGIGGLVAMSQPLHHAVNQYVYEVIGRDLGKKEKPENFATIVGPDYTVDVFHVKNFDFPWDTQPTEPDLTLEYLKWPEGVNSEHEGQMAPWVLFLLNFLDIAGEEDHLQIIVK